MRVATSSSFKDGHLLLKVTATCTDETYYIYRDGERHSGSRYTNPNSVLVEITPSSIDPSSVGVQAGQLPEEDFSCLRLDNHGNAAFGPESYSSSWSSSVTLKISARTGSAFRKDGGGSFTTLVIPVANEQVAIRLASAFRHLASLAGSVKEPF
jgi:hypothetical protein